ncbi:MAG: AAA family ATPase [Thermoproteota archaeon]
MLEAEISTRSMLAAREIILENFMSYKYARVPLRPGLNLILGPNGSGKSSILIALSVVLGQSHTERGRKLSDLIRRGEQIARVTLIFDNRAVGGKRPVPEVRSDELVLTRYIKIDGEYWYQINYKPVTKMEVDDTLRRFGIDPNNMLIIMQQYMIEEFVVLDPVERLRVFEGAVGISQLREKVIASRERLRDITSEEHSVEAMMKDARNTLERWRSEYEKLLKKREILHRISELERELKWSLADEKMAQVTELVKRVKFVQEKILRLKSKEVESLNKSDRTYSKLVHLISRYREILLTHVEVLYKAGSDTSSRVMRLEQAITKGVKLFAKDHARSAIFRIRVKDYTRRQKKLTDKLNVLNEELNSLTKDAERTGPRPEITRNTKEITKDIEACRLTLASLGIVLEDADRMYEAYQKSFEDLESKLNRVKEARQKALEELKSREDVWRESLMNIITKVNEKFRRQLVAINAIGDITVSNIDDIESAGLHIMVGFKGSEPVELNYFTQSGGERSVSVISFLLALQSFIPSPIRAIDEFDVHMDPLNRDAFFKMLSEEAYANPSICYISITPGRLVGGVKWSSALVVQNVYGSSNVSVITPNE